MSPIKTNGKKSDACCYAYSGRQSAIQFTIPQHESLRKRFAKYQNTIKNGTISKDGHTRFFVEVLVIALFVYQYMLSDKLLKTL